MGLLALLTVLTGSGLAFPVHSMAGSNVSGVTTLDHSLGSVATQSCSASGLATLSVTPAKTSVLPLEVRTFTATPADSCGNPLSGNASFKWWLSNVELGTLGATSGATVSYSACVAPMSGILHVRATVGGVTRYANSSISVSGEPSPSSGSPPTGSGGPIGSGDAQYRLPEPGTEIGIIVILVVGALVALWVGRRGP